MKSKEIFLLKERTLRQLSQYGLNQILKKAIEALETAEKEIEESEEENNFLRENNKKLKEENEQQKELIYNLMIENQGLKYFIEKNHGGNCVIAPKEEVDKIAKKRYEEAWEYLNEYYNCDVNESEYCEVSSLHKAFKIAAGINN